MTEMTKITEMNDKKNTTAAYIAQISPQIAHYAAHILAGIAAVSLWYPITPMNATMAIIFALMPDIDTNLEIPHRTATHSIAAIAIIAIGGYSSSGQADEIAISVIAYASHIATDLFHGIGIQLLWPLSPRFFSIAQISPAIIAAVAAIIASVIPLTPTPPLAPPPPPTATPTATPTITPTATPTITPTTTPTATPTTTPTPTADFWRITELRLEAEKAANKAEFICRAYGKENIECKNAKFDAEIRKAQFCRIAACTSTPSPNK